MLGIAAFSQVPFSTLANSAYAFDIAEAVGVDDASSQLYAL